MLFNWLRYSIRLFPLAVLPVNQCQTLSVHSNHASSRLLEAAVQSCVKSCGAPHRDGGNVRLVNFSFQASPVVIHRWSNVRNLFSQGTSWLCLTAACLYAVTAELRICHLSAAADLLLQVSGVFEAVAKKENGRLLTSS